MLIDSSAETAKEVAGILAYRGTFRTGGGPGNREFCVTDLPAQFTRSAGVSSGRN